MGVDCRGKFNFRFDVDPTAQRFEPRDRTDAKFVLELDVELGPRFCLVQDNVAVTGFKIDDHLTQGFRIGERRTDIGGARRIGARSAFAFPRCQLTEKRD